jgi:plastocyanin
MALRRVIQLGGLAVLAACGGSGGNDPNQPPPPTASQDVEVINNQFDPPNVGVTPSTTVTWTWNSSGIDHNVKWASAPVTPLPPSSPTQNAGTFQVTFQTPGLYRYVCSIHAGMEGFVTVQ